MTGPLLAWATPRVLRRGMCSTRLSTASRRAPTEWQLRSPGGTHLCNARKSRVCVSTLKYCPSGFRHEVRSFGHFFCSTLSLARVTPCLPFQPIRARQLGLWRSLCHCAPQRHANAGHPLRSAGTIEESSMPESTACGQVRTAHAVGQAHPPSPPRVTGCPLRQVPLPAHALPAQPDDPPPPRAAGARCCAGWQRP